MEKTVSLEKGSLRGKVLRLFGIGRGFEELSSNEGKMVVYENSQVSKKRLSDTLGVEAYLISNQRGREVEAQKAMLSMLSRYTTAHDRRR